MLAALALIIGLSSAAWASLESDGCEYRVRKFGGRCSWVSGLPYSKNDARYVKISRPGINLSQIICIHQSYHLVYPSINPKEGRNTESFSMCTDVHGKNCEVFAEQSYEVSKSGKKKVVNPNTFEADASDIKNRFPSCKSKY